jgi:hypothetical protein
MPNSQLILYPPCRFHPMRVMLNNVRYGLMDAKLKVDRMTKENIVRENGGGNLTVFHGVCDIREKPLSGRVACLTQSFDQEVLLRRLGDIAS